MAVTHNVEPEIVTIETKELKAWENRLRGIQSALWDLDYKHMAGDVEIVRQQIRKKFLP